MKSEMEIQKRNAKGLMNLIAQDPTLPIVPMVDSEVVSDDGHNWWLGHWGKAEIDHMCVIGERIYFKSLDTEELIEGYIDDNDGDVQYSPSECGFPVGDLDTEGEDWLNSLPWEKVIVVWIQPR